MKRSISYLATASAIRSAPSTCTSSREKFLQSSANSTPIHRIRHTLWDSPALQGCILRLNALRFPQGMLCFVDHIPKCNISTLPFLKMKRTGEPTIKTTLPRSPVTFRCLFAMSSRKGTTTVHPREAVRLSKLSPYASPIPTYQVGERCTDQGIP